MFPNDYDASDTPVERALRESTANLREALRDVINDAQYALSRLDEGQRPGSGLSPGRVIDSRKVNGHCAQFEALLSLPWGHGIEGDPEKANEIVRTAGKAG